MSERRPHDAEYETVELRGGTPSARAGDTTFAPGKQVGRFVILDEVGEGGMGIVLAAYDPALDRKVAIKVLHPTAHGRASADGRERLLREARAMAKLSHPNVLGVFEAGVVADQVFIAMEFAAQTLRQWLDHGGGIVRTRAEVLAVFQAAGRGLEAAHRAGIVHRDFKPENVLLTDDGRARVADFGLAGVRGGAARRERDDEDRPASTRSRVTETGSMMGTPAYMAAEQYLGERVDGRADQFAFCVALHEALYGERPFAGKTIAALRAAITEGTPRPPPPGRDVPAWLREILLRGLHRDPDRRFASMGELLAALAADPDARRRRRLVAAGVVGGAVVLAAAAVAIVSLQAPRAVAIDPCPADPGRLTGVWDDARKAEVHAAFLASGHGNAEDAFQRTSAALDAYATSWVAARRETCRATHVKHEQSAATLDARMACLDRRLGQTRSLVDLYRGDVDVKMVDRAVDAVDKLTPVASCSAIASFPPPAAEIGARVEALWKLLAVAKAHSDAGRYAEGLPVAVQALAMARTLDYEPTLAEALVTWSALAWQTGDLESAEAGYSEVVKIASAAGDDPNAALAWSMLLFIVGDQQGRVDDALRMVPAAEAAMARVPNDPTLQAGYWNNLGNVYRARGDYAEARRRFERALSEAERGEPGNQMARTFSNLGTASLRLDELDEANDYFDRALALWEIRLGADHPNVLGVLNNKALVLIQQAKYVEAAALLRRIVAAREKVLGPEHPQVAAAYANLSSAIMYQASELDDQTEMARKYDEARVALERAVAIGEKTMPDLPEHAAALSNLGMTLGELGRHDEALVRLEQARKIKEQRLGRDHPSLFVIEKAIASELVDADRPAEAVAHARRALALREGRPGDVGEIGEIQYILANALWDSGARREGVAAGRKSLASYEEADESWRKNRDAAAEWLKTHR